MFENTKKVLVTTGYLLVPKSTFSKGYACLFSESKFAQIPWISANGMAMVEGSDGRGSSSGSKPEIRSRQAPGELVAMDGGLAGGVVGGHEAAA